MTEETIRSYEERLQARAKNNAYYKRHKDKIAYKRWVQTCKLTDEEVAARRARAAEASKRYRRQKALNQCIS